MRKGYDAVLCCLHVFHPQFIHISHSTLSSRSRLHVFSGMAVTWFVLSDVCLYIMVVSTASASMHNLVAMLGLFRAAVVKEFSMFRELLSHVLSSAEGKVNGMSDFLFIFFILWYCTYH